MWHVCKHIYLLLCVQLEYEFIIIYRVINTVYKIYIYIYLYINVYLYHVRARVCG